jgi:predicted nucleotidyltransferase
MEFERECRKEYEWAQKDISPFMAVLGSIAQKEGLSVEFYGSFATGLWVKQSNIDIQLVSMDSLHEDTLDRVAESLKKHSICKSPPVFSRSGRLPHLRC